MAYAAPTYKIPTITNLDQLKAQLNTIFAKIAAAQPGYGSSLPAVGSVPDGTLYYVSPSLYQAQGGSWVVV